MIAAKTDTRSTAWLALAVGGIAFQVVHFVEHIAQLAYWGAHPTEAPWLTPWAAAGRDALAFGHNPGTGSELLHLLGNVVFLAAVVALWRSAGGGRAHGALRGALWVQGAHVGEHVLLTATWVATGTALGTSTLFGALQGPVLFGFRIWWHLLVNLAATVLAVWALRDLRATSVQPTGR